MDPAGQNLLYALAIAGIIEEFGTLKAGLAAFGLASLPELYAAVVDPGFTRLVKNDDGVVCYKPVLNQRTVPEQRTTSPTDSQPPTPSTIA